MAQPPLSPQVERRYRANVWKFYVYYFLMNSHLWMSIWVLYLLDRGLTMTQVMVMDAPFWLLMVLSEVPTGAIADAFGRKVSIACGTLLYALAVLVFGLATTFPILIASYLIWAIAISLQSGADSAFLYDSLKAIGRQDDFRKVMGRAVAIMQIAGALAGLLGGWLAGMQGLAFPVILSSIITFVAFLFTLTFTEPEVEGGKRERYQTIIKESFALSARNRNIRYLMLYSSSLGLVTYIASGIFFQPYLKDMGIPVHIFGFIFLLTRGAGMLGGTMCHRLTGLAGERRVYYLIPLTTISAVVILATLRSPFGIAFFMLLSFASAFSSPLILDAINREIPTSQRATMISLQSLFRSAIYLPAEPLFGWIHDRGGQAVSFYSLAASLAVSMCGILGLWHLPERRRGASKPTPVEPSIEKSPVTDIVEEPGPAES